MRTELKSDGHDGVWLMGKINDICYAHFSPRTVLHASSKTMYTTVHSFQSCRRPRKHLPVIPVSLFVFWLFLFFVFVVVVFEFLSFISCRSTTQGPLTAQSSSSSISQSSTDGGRQISFLAQQPVEEVMVFTYPMDCWLL